MNTVTISEDRYLELYTKSQQWDQEIRDAELKPLLCALLGLHISASIQEIVAKQIDALVHGLPPNPRPELCTDSNRSSLQEKGGSRK